MSRWRLLHLALAAALLALLLWKVDLADVRDVLSGVDPLMAAAVVALNVPVMLLFAVRSHLVLARLGHRIDMTLLLPAAILGNIAGALTPASAGDLLRAAVLHSHADMPAEDSVALVVYERAVSVYIMALGTGVVAAFIALPLSAALAVAAAALPLFALPFAGGALLRLLPAPRGDAGGVPARMLRRAHEVAGRLRLLLDDRRLLVAWSAVTAAIFALITLQYWLLCRTISHAVRPEEAWVAFGASQLAGIASLLPLGLGAADGSLAAVLRRMGTTLEQGAGVAVLVRATATPLGLAAVASYVYLLRRAPTAAAPGDDHAAQPPSTAAIRGKPKETPPSQR